MAFASCVAMDTTQAQPGLRVVVGWVAKRGKIMDRNGKGRQVELKTKKNSKLRSVGKWRRCRVVGCCCCAWRTRQVKWWLLL